MFCFIIRAQIEAANKISATAEFRETVADMFKVAATSNSTPNENIVDISEIVKQKNLLNALVN